MNFSNITSKLNPLAERLGRSLDNAVQWTEEKLNTGESSIELPQDYRDLEMRVDAIRSVHFALIRNTRCYAQPTYKEPADFQDTVRNVTGKLHNFALGPDAMAQQDENSEDQPKNHYQSLARVAHHGCDQVGLEEPFGAALFKYANVAEKIGDSEVKMCKEITEKFYQPFQTTLNTAIQTAMLGRKRVNSARVRLDNCKNRYKTVTPDREVTVRAEVEQAEELYLLALEETTTLMKAVVESPEPLRNLADLVAAQLAHAKATYDLLQDLAPEIDEMQVTQEALYRNTLGNE